MTINDAAKRAATKIRDAMPWSMTDESFEELVNEISAEFAGFVPMPKPVSDVELDDLERIGKKCTSVTSARDLYEAQAALPRLISAARENKKLSAEIDRLRGLLKLARTVLEIPQNRQPGTTVWSLLADIDAALKGATE